MRRGARRGTAVLLLVACLLATACGTKVPRDEIIAAAGASRDSGDTGGGGSGLALDPTGEAGGEVGRGPAGGAGDVSGPAAQQGDRSGPAAQGGTSGGGGGGPRAANLSPIRLGHVGTYSGLLGAIFLGGREMVQAWAQSVNQRGGLNGHPVEIVTGDDGGDPSRNLQLVRDMVERQGVVAFVANIVPLSVTGSLAYLEERGIPAIGGDGATTTWWESEVLFPVNGHIDSGLLGAVDEAVGKGKRKIGLLYCGEASACTNARDLYTRSAVAERGGELAYVGQVSLAQPDFTAECIQARSAGVQALVMALDGNSVQRVARSCQQQGFRPALVSFGLALVNSIARAPELEGLIGLSTTFPWFLQVPETAEYFDALRRFAPNVDPSGATATVWGGGKLMEKVGERLDADPSSSEILALAGQVRDETLGGLAVGISFRQGGTAARVPCWYPLEISGGAFTAPNGLRPTCA